MMIIYDFSSGYMHRPRRTAEIEVVTIHSLQGGESTLVGVDEWYQDRIKKGYASCSNYAISYDGKVGIYVPEDRRAATSSSTKNDNRALTIEVATTKDAPLYALYTDAEHALICLLHAICEEHGKKGLQLLTEDKKYGRADDGYLGVTLHRWYADTDCPGEDILNRLPRIIDAVNASLRVFYRVQVGAYEIYRNAEKKLQKVKAAGFPDAYITTNRKDNS